MSGCGGARVTNLHRMAARALFQVWAIKVWLDFRKHIILPTNCWYMFIVELIVIIFVQVLPPQPLYPSQLAQMKLVSESM